MEELRSAGDRLASAQRALVWFQLQVALRSWLLVLSLQREPGVLPDTGAWMVQGACPGHSSQPDTEESVYWFPGAHCHELMHIQICCGLSLGRGDGRARAARREPHAARPFGVHCSVDSNTEEGD